MGLGQREDLVQYIQTLISLTLKSSETNLHYPYLPTEITETLARDYFLLFLFNVNRTNFKEWLNSPLISLPMTLFFFLESFI